MSDRGNTAVIGRGGSAESWPHWTIRRTQAGDWYISCWETGPRGTYWVSGVRFPSGAEAIAAFAAGGR